MQARLHHLALGLLLATLVRSRSATDMETNAQALVDALATEQRTKLCFAFDDATRLKWSYLPGARAGLRLKDMDAAARRAAHTLMRSLLSSQGYLKVTSIMALEPVLAQMEIAAGGNGAARDAEQYAFAVFGQPSSAKPWGWRMEGHHVVITFTSVGSGVALTPMFLGTHPAEIQSGPSAGLRILGREEDVAIQLMQHLDAEERAAATMPGAVPGDVLAGPARGVADIEPKGLPLAQMESDDMALLRELVRAFTGNFGAAEAAAAEQRIFDGDLAAMRFAWWGTVAPRQACAWRLRTVTSVLEFDNREAGSGHAHLVWRDGTRDHGADLLEQHLREHHGEKR